MSRKPLVPVPDVLANLAARALLLDLDDRGIRLTVRRGRLATAQAAQLTDADRAGLTQHKAALLVLVLMTSDRVLDRLALLREGARPRGPVPSGVCVLCAEPLEAGGAQVRCGWCALAERLYAGGPIPPDILGLFPLAVRGDQPATQTRPAGSAGSNDGLPYDAPSVTAQRSVGGRVAS